MPYRHARQAVEVRACLRTIEIFLKGERILGEAKTVGPNAELACQLIRATSSS